MTRAYKNPQVNLRLPEELKQKIAELALKHRRSANAEMVAAIESWVELHDIPDDKELSLSEVALGIRKLQQQLKVVAKDSILILDESESHLNSEVEQQLNDYIKIQTTKKKPDQS